MRTLFTLIVAVSLSLLTACGTGGGSSDSSDMNTSGVPGIEVSAKDISTSEGGAQSTVFINATAAPASGEMIVIDVASDDVTEGTVSLAQITFDETDWQIQKSFDIIPTDDAIYDGPQTFHVTLDKSASTDPEYALLGTTTIIIQNADNEAGFAAQGSKADPIDITGQVPYEGMADDTYSYYMISIDPSKVYSIEVNGYDQLMGFEAYKDNNFFDLATLNICFEPVNPAQNYAYIHDASLYIVVYSCTESGSSFEISVTEVPTTEYFVETMPNASGNGADTQLIILDRYGFGHGANDDIGPSKYSQLTFPFVSGESYFVLVSDPWYKGSFYSIKLSAIGFSNSSSGTAGTPDIYEPDSMASPTTLEFEIIQHHSLSPAGELDWFVFTAP